MSESNIESILQEKRLFPPTAAFSQNAQIKSLEEYQQLCDRAQKDPQKFWAELAEQELHWFEKWDTVLDWQPPFAKWFVGGKTNISYNCLDRHLTTWRARLKLVSGIGKVSSRCTKFSDPIQISAEELVINCAVERVKPLKIPV